MNLEPTTSILIVEDQSLVRDAIAMLLSLEDDLTIVAKCSNGQEAINYLNDNIFVKNWENLNKNYFQIILKESDSDYLIDAIHKVSAGDKVISPELAIMALDDNNPLSQKEMSALKLASDGLKTQAIAQQLFLSEGTVRNYLSEAISKLDATNRVDAARIAKQKGWL